MNRILTFTIAAIIVITGLAIYLHHQDTLLGDPDFLTFNRSEKVRMEKTLTDWRSAAKSKEKEAVQNIIRADYVLIVVYLAYFLWALKTRRKYLKSKTPESRLPAWLNVAFFTLIAAGALDFFQDTVIYTWLSSAKIPIYSLYLITWIKWRLFIFTAIVFIVSLLPPGWITIDHARLVKNNLAAILKSAWLFFPSILFITLVILCFWKAGPGKDILIAFTETDDTQFRFIFFFVVGFWVYITWYSSRVIAYIKHEHGRFIPDYLKFYPVLAGNACFLVLELAIWQAPLFDHPLDSTVAIIIFAVALIGLLFFDQWIARWIGEKEQARTESQGSKLREDKQLKLAQRFWVVFVIFLILVMTLNILPFHGKTYLYILFGLLLVFHLIYGFYTNLHRVMIGPDQKFINMVDAKNFREKILAFFCIPKEEENFLLWLTRITVLMILVDWLVIIFVPAARWMGPLSIVLLGFSVLLAFGNLITAISVRLHLNLHLILLLIAIGMLKLGETHYVRAQILERGTNGYDQRPGLQQYVRAWLDRIPDSATSYNMYIVLSNGGASRSAYWTASVLGKLQDSTRSDSAGSFADHLFCLSGTSGGGLGVAAFYALLNDHRPLGACYRKSAVAFLKDDYFSFTASRLLGPDYFNYIFMLTGSKDRAAALEESLEGYHSDSLYTPEFDKPFGQFPALDPKTHKVAAPLLFINTTRMQDGNPGVVTNLYLENQYFNNRIDVVNLLPKDSDITIASAAILGARFPYVSPAGRIQDSYFVDGGYFDNSGAGVVQELLRGIMNTAWDDSTRPNSDRKFYNKVKKLRINVLHIENSPVDPTVVLTPVAAIKNDLLSPVLTILGAYNMQTSVNDQRLYRYLDDLKTYFHIPTILYRISLYEDLNEWKADSLSKVDSTEPPYPMNWFISGYMAHRMETRLDSIKIVDTILANFNTPHAILR